MKKQLFLFLFFLMSFSIVSMDKLSELKKITGADNVIIGCVAYKLSKDKESLFSIIPVDCVTSLLPYLFNENEINTLYSHCADKNDKRSLLSWAISFKIPDLQNFLLQQKKIDVNSEDPYSAPLLVAARHNDTILCKKLIDMKANCDIFTVYCKQSPLGFAIDFLNTDLVALYLENEKEILFRKSFLFDAVIKALSLSDYPCTGSPKEAINIIELLIKAGANIETVIQKAEAIHRSFCNEYEDYKQRKWKKLPYIDQFTKNYYLHRNVQAPVHLTQEFIYESEEFKVNIIKLLQQYQKEIPSGQQKLDLVEKLRRFKLKGILQDLQRRLAQEENSYEKNERRIADYKESIEKIKKELEENIDLCLQETLAHLEELKSARSDQIKVVQEAKRNLYEEERALLKSLKEGALLSKELKLKPSKKLPSRILHSKNGIIFHLQKKRLNRLKALIELEESKAEEYKQIPMLKAQERKNKKKISALKAQQKEDPSKERRIAALRAKKEDKIRTIQKKATKAEDKTTLESTISQLPPERLAQLKKENENENETRVYAALKTNAETEDKTILESTIYQLSQKRLAQLKQQKENDPFSHTCSIM